ncbi:MAG: hypothetical protein ACI9WU_001819 [Myxococcota bacterium]|jgi:hypothetical protein
MSVSRLSLLFALVGFLTPALAAADCPDQAGVDALVKHIDDAQRNGGDWKARVFIEQKERDKDDVVYEAATYRRDADDKLMILFLRPKAERGKGYLRISKNLWFYDPRVGKWERRTERERIGGTDSNRADFDESRLFEEYDAKCIGQGKLGKFQVNKLVLTAKKGIDVGYPKLELWVDVETKNVLKRLDFAVSGKLMRKALYPKWRKLFSPSKKADVWFPKQIYIFDMIERGNKTTILIKDVDLNTLPANIFTKAWLESKSR